MPLYEYWCPGCQRKVMLYVKIASQASPCCPECGTDTLQRLFSTFSVRKTDSAIYDDILSDSHLTRGMMNNDPRALVEWNSRMSRGEKVAPEYEDMIGKMEKGEMPSELTSTHTKESTEAVA